MQSKYTQKKVEIMGQQANKAVKYISFGVVCTLFILLVVLVFQFARINNLRNQERDLLANLRNLESQIVYYTNQNSYLESNNFISDHAREMLGYGRSGETFFRGI